MKSFLKYFLTAFIAMAATAYLINLYAPFLFEVPKKDKELIKIDFQSEVTNRNIQPVTNKAKNIIFLIGDGMGSNHITSYRVMKGGPNYITAFDKFPISGLVKTHALNTLITDSAASATAFSSGVKTINRYVGVNPEKIAVKNILEILNEKGYISSLVATSEITHATPAAFAAHVDSRYEKDKIATAIFDSKINFILGGGKGYFYPKSKGGFREDEEDLISKIKNQYTLIETKEALNLEFPQSSRIFGLFAEDELVRKESEPSLVDMFKFVHKKSLEHIANGCRGYFALIEGSMIDWRSHDNNFQSFLIEMAEFEEVVDDALEVAKQEPDTLLIVTADHETGGLLIEPTDIRYRPTGKMNISWNTGIGIGSHTGGMVPVFAFGPGSENFSGIMDNTDIFFAMKEALGIDSLENASCL